MIRIALVHDYLTQEGGAERVVLTMLRAFPGAPVYTSLYAPGSTFAEFRAEDVRPLWINRLAPLRTDHRRAFPVLAAAFSSLRVDADLAICTSSGWAHGARASGRKLVYCFNPARWLYQTEDALPRRTPARLALGAVRAPLVRWDRAAALGADRYLTSSSVVRRRILDAYGITADVLPPPSGLVRSDDRVATAGLRPGFLLAVGRLLPYKNVGEVSHAVGGLPGERLVVVGVGPLERSLRASAPPNVRYLGRVGDAQLRWLYDNCAGVVTAAHEDFGLTPLEAGAHGKPVAALRRGGFLDTVVEGVTGCFFDAPEARQIQDAIRRMRARDWSAEAIRTHAEGFSEDRFIRRLRSFADDELSRSPQPRRG